MLVSYKGPITPVVMAEITLDLRQKILHNAIVQKRMVSIFIELIQNILYYSTERIEYGGRTESVGALQIMDMHTHYLFSCSNMIEKSDTYTLLNNCSIINNMGREELRTLKRQQRNQSIITDSKGAGIGLVQVAILANNPLEIYIDDVNHDYSFYTLGVRIDK